MYIKKTNKKDIHEIVVLVETSIAAVNRYRNCRLLFDCCDECDA